MNSGDILRYVMMAAGIYMFGLAVISLARKKMTEAFCLAWGLLAFLLVLGGILLRPTQVSRYVSNTGFVLIVLGGGVVLTVFFFLSRQISDLVRKNRELAMQVSLLNLQAEQIRKELKAMKRQEKNGREKEDSFCD